MTVSFGSSEYHHVDATQSLEMCAIDFIIGGFRSQPLDFSIFNVTGVWESVVGSWSFDEAWGGNPYVILMTCGTDSV